MAKASQFITIYERFYRNESDGEVFVLECIKRVRRLR